MALLMRERADLAAIVKLASRPSVEATNLASMSWGVKRSAILERRRCERYLCCNGLE